MRLETIFSNLEGDARRRDLPRVESELLETLIPRSSIRGDGEEAPWEVEIGFGKGRYLLRRAEEDPDRRFLGIEIVSRYQRLAARRARRRALKNLVLVRGEALYLLAAALPANGFDAVHVYFPDPWPKSRHQKRRLFDPESVDLVLSLLAPGGRLFFATDHQEYGARTIEILRDFPGLDMEIHKIPWPEGPRTNYEAKYMEEGRPIVRLTASFPTAEVEKVFHPIGVDAILTAPRPPKLVSSEGAV